MYADSIRAAQEGLFERRLVFGSISHGYGGQVIDGEFSRTGKPRRRLVIDETTATVVRLVFHQYVNKLLGLKEIARVLDDDTFAATSEAVFKWTLSDDTVRRILTNTRYCGYWQYGITEAVYLSDVDYVRKVTRAETTKSRSQIEELRIIDDDLWFAAADRIAQNGHGHAVASPDGDLAARPDDAQRFMFRGTSVP